MQLLRGSSPPPHVAHHRRWVQIRALRRKLENAPSRLGAAFASKEADAPPKDISVFLWPAHRIVHLPVGTTAGHVICAQVLPKSKGPCDTQSLAVCGCLLPCLTS